MDSEGCVKIDTFEVSQPDLLTVNITENSYLYLQMLMGEYLDILIDGRNFLISL